MSGQVESGQTRPHRRGWEEETEMTSRSGTATTKKREDEPTSARIRRNLRRALSWRRKRAETTVGDESKEGKVTEGATEIPSKERAAGKPGTVAGARPRGKLRRSFIRWVREETLNPAEERDTPPPPLTERAPEASRGDPGLIYAQLEENMRLTRIEDTKVLTAALRQWVRTGHPRGRTICFPGPAAVDRMILASAALPTDSAELVAILHRAFARRGVALRQEEVYEDFVRAHGRTAIVTSKQWPESHIQTRHP